MVAAASVTWMVVHMWRAGRHMKGEIEGRLRLERESGYRRVHGRVSVYGPDGDPRRDGDGATADAVEGNDDLAIGAAAGLVGAACSHPSGRATATAINLGLFFQVTAIFLFVFVVQLLITGVHEMSEQHFCRSAREHHDDRGVGARQRVRSSVDLPAGHPAARLAADQGCALEAAGLLAGGAVGPAGFTEPARYLDPTAFAFRRSIGS